jgi:hypothetical protein
MPLFTPLYSAEPPSKRKRSLEGDSISESGLSDNTGNCAVRDDAKWTAGDVEVITSDNCRFWVPRELLVSTRCVGTTT